MKNVLVTGGTGFVGSHLTRKLVNDGCNVTLLEHDGKKDSLLFDIFNLRGKINIARGDIKSIKQLFRILVDYQIDTVFHLAAQPIVSKAYIYPMHTYETNVFGTLAMLEAARAFNQLQAFVSASTDKVYGEADKAKETDSLNARGIYETSKICMDVICRSYYYAYRLPIVVTRACNIYGFDPFNRRIVPNTIISMLKNKPPVIFRDEAGIREYIHVEDVCDAYIFLANHIQDVKGKAVNVGTGDVVSQEELVLIITEIGNSILGTNLKPVYISRTGNTREIQQQSLNSTKVNKLGWFPKRKLREGLRQTFQEFVAHVSLLHNL